MKKYFLLSCIGVIVCLFAFSDVYVWQTKKSSDFSNLEALTKRQEETGYVVIEWNSDGDAWEDSLYRYEPYTHYVNCMTGGNKDCTQSKVNHIIKINKKTLSSTDEIQ